VSCLRIEIALVEGQKVASSYYHHVEVIRMLKTVDRDKRKSNSEIALFSYN